MEITGDFFLCMPATQCVTRDGASGVLFALREPAPAPTFPNGVTAVWVGDEAQAFLRERGPELRPGRGLHLALTRLTARDGEIRARVATCELLPLPPSWLRAQQETARATPASA